MKFTEQTFEIIPQKDGLDNMLKHIEYAGRTCYKSEANITTDSAKAFVESLKVKHHLSVLEHGTIYLEFHVTDPSIVGEEEYHKQQDTINKLISKYSVNPYSKVFVNHYWDYCAITTNYRVIIENNWIDDLKYLCSPTHFHAKRVTVKFTTCIHVYKDITRHRLASFSIESTRYCNYSKNKFGNQLNFVKAAPYDNSSWLNKLVYRTCLKVIEWSYLFLVNHGWKAESAAELLPQATKADVVMTKFVEDWYHVFGLRADTHAHPLVQQLFYPLHQQFIRFGYK